MPAIVPAIAAELANGARDVLRQGAAVVTGNQGEYIANGEPESIYGKIQQATARQACRRYADDPTKFTGRGAVLVENACRPYLDDIGYGSPPSIKQPFNGGQCSGVLYTVTFQYSTILTDGSTQEPPVVATSNAIGPISGIRGQGAPDFQNIVIDSGVGPDFARTGNCTQGCFRNISIISVVRADGQPDTCGNLPPVITDPVPPTSPGPRREPFNPDPSVDIDIEVEINPDLTIEVDFGTGPITIDPFGDEPSGGGNGGAGAPPGDVGDPGTPEDTGPGGDADGEAPEGTVLTGLRVDFAEPPIGGKEYAPGVYRGVCYIYMGTPQGLDHDPAGAMLRSGQFVFAEKHNLTRWAVSANLGFSLRITPYYRPVEAED